MRTCKAAPAAITMPSQQAYMGPYPAPYPRTI